MSVLRHRRQLRQRKPLSNDELLRRAMTSATRAANGKPGLRKSK